MTKDVNREDSIDDSNIALIEKPSFPRTSKVWCQVRMLYLGRDSVQTLESLCDALVILVITDVRLGLKKMHSPDDPEKVVVLECLLVKMTMSLDFSI